MRSVIAIFSVVASIAAAACPIQAHADAGANNPAALQEARRHHIAGDGLYANGDYAGAHAAYSAAWRLTKHYQIAGNLGDCELRLGRYRDAAEHLAYFIREYPKDKPADRLNDAKKLLESARSQIGTISVVVDAPAADVFIDGKFIGRSPLKDAIHLDPGARLIEARRGEASAKTTVQVTRGGTQAVVLKPTAHPAPPQPVVAAKPVWQKRLVPLVATAGASLVSLGAGVGFAAASNGKAGERDALKDKLEDPRSSCWSPSAANKNTCARIQSLDADASMLQGVSAGSFLLGGLAAAGAAAIFFWPDKSQVPLRVEATTVIGPDGAAVGLKGEF